MIRIDLGKDSKKQGEAIRKVATQLKLQQPYDELLAKFDNDINRLIAFVVAIALAIIPYLFVGEYQRVVKRNYEAKIKGIDKELAVVETEIQSLMPYKAELDSYESQKAQVSQRLGVIRQLLDSRGTPVVTFDAIGQALPEGVWLESVSFDAPEKATEKISLQGRALSNEDISDFADRLAQSTYLKNVKILSVESGVHHSLEVRLFSIDLEASPPVPSALPSRELGGIPK